MKLYTWLLKVAGEDEDTSKISEIMLKAVVHALLMYGSEIWMFTDVVIAVLEGFQHIITRQIAGMTARKCDDGNGSEPW